MKYIPKLLLLVFLSSVIFSCTSMKTQKTHFVDIDQLFLSRDFDGAIAKLKKAKDKQYSQKDRVLYYLDLGMLLHYAKRYNESIEMLTKAEQGIDELFTKSISKAAASILLNDNVLDYSGEDYEDIYLNVFKALNFIELAQFDAAFVEIRRINEKLKLLEQKHTNMAEKFNLSKNKQKNFKAGKNKFHNSALGRYLSLLLYRIEGQMDDARIDKEKIDEAWKLQSHIYNFKKPDLSDNLKFSDKIKVNFLSFVGRAPEKKAKTLYIHTEENLIIIGTTKENPQHKESLKTLDAINWPDVQAGYHFKFQLPEMKKRNQKVGFVKVFVDGQEQKRLELIEKIEDVALETYNVKKPIVYLKTITRSVIKGLIAEKGKEKLEAKLDNPLLGFVTRIATDAAMDATENADLRISRYFPAQVLIGEIELNSGEHHIKIEYYSQNGNRIFTDDLGVKTITKDGINIYESFYLE